MHHITNFLQNAFFKTLLILTACGYGTSAMAQELWTLPEPDCDSIVLSCVEIASWTEKQVFHYENNRPSFYLIDHDGVDSYENIGFEYTNDKITKFIENDYFQGGEYWYCDVDWQYDNGTAKKILKK